MKRCLLRESLGLWRPESGDPALGIQETRAPREENQEKKG
jgi:hypothetical protein